MEKQTKIPGGTKAVILAGGKGTRLHPYTIALPKPLVPVGERPILEIVLERLSSYNIHDVVISVGHLAELIMAFFQNGEKWNVNIQYAIEDKPLGTMGPLAIIDDLGDDFFVMNGDVLSDLDFQALYKVHVESEAIMTVATFRRRANIDFGILSYDDQTRRVESFNEKPSIPYDVSMGIYVLSKRCIRYIPQNKYYGFDDLMMTLLEKGEKVQSFPHKGKWLDIGRPEDYEIANRHYYG